MDTDRAKFILQAYRPGGQDDGDPQFAEALTLARENPELMGWQEEQRALDTAIRRKLRAAGAPPELPARIQAGLVVRRERRRQQYLALAACVALLAVVTGFWLARPKPQAATPFSAYRQEMADFLKQFPRLDLQTERLTEIRQWLEREHAIARVEIPAGLEKFPGIGCRTVEWRGKKLALVCFMVEGEVVHLFVIPRSQFPEAPLDATPQFAEPGGMTAAWWQKGDLTYVALTKGDQAFLRKCL